LEDIFVLALLDSLEMTVKREALAIQIPVVMMVHAARLMNHIRAYVNRDTKERTVESLISVHQTLARTEEFASRKTMITSATVHKVLKEKPVK